MTLLIIPFTILFIPKKGRLYIGWTEPGEWTNYANKVKTAGVYQVKIMYTANCNVQISLSVNDLDLAGPKDIILTYVDTDSLS